jgi:hypothetical protein
VIAATSIAELRTLAGRELGASDWLEVTHRARAVHGRRVARARPDNRAGGRREPVCVAEFLIRVFEKED